MDDRSIEDGDFDYGKARGGAAERVLVANQPHDEEFSVSDSTDHDSMSSSENPSLCPAQGGHLSTTGTSTSKPNYDDMAATLKEGSGNSSRQTAQGASSTSTQEHAATSSSASGDAAFPGGYDHKQYDSLTVDPAVKQLFSFIGRYQPRKQKLVSELKPFIPDYIAAIGDVDEFLKPPRPDGKFERLGLEVLDEPSANQSDPAIMRKFLRANMKGATALEDHDDACISHDDADRDCKIDQWIKDVEGLRESEAVGEFKPQGRFPTMDSLMQTWPEELEPLVRNLRRPGNHVDMSTPALAKALCAVLDIPVYDDVIDSLHCMFMLFLEMKNNEAINPPVESAIARSWKPNFVSFS